MIDFNNYLKRIGIDEIPVPGVASLNSLQVNHLLSIPFENLDIHTGKKIILDPLLLYNKIVVNKRGGFCYELNGLFYELLKWLGFDAFRVSARVYDSSEPGPEFDHMAIIVKINNEMRLADVGFGDSFMEPLLIEAGLKQKQYGKFYRINTIDEDDMIVTVSSDGNKFSNMYRFSLMPRELSEFNEMCNYHQTSPDSHFTRKRLISQAFKNGRITLSGLKFINTNNHSKTEIILKNEKEFNIKLKEHFGIEI